MKNYVFPILSVIGFAIAVAYVIVANKPLPVAKPIALPAEAKFASYISGAGITEANTENIAIGTEISGIVSEIYVRVGSQVKKGAPLFKIDDRDAKAGLFLAEASLGEAKATLADAKDQLREEEAVKDKRAVSKDEVSRKRFLVEEAAAKVETAKASIFTAKTTLDRLLVVAPVDGEIMKLNVHLGEYASSGVLASPLILFGSLDPMSIRINIDENDAWRFKIGAKGVASLRGNRNMSVQIRFVRIEPFVTPKVSLTGDSTEQVDTRVLQVIYEYDVKDLPSYSGQQVDVYIEADPLPVNLNNDKPTEIKK